MTRFRTVLTAALAATLATASLVHAADDDAQKERAKDQITYFNRDSKKAKDDYKYAELMYELAATRHPLVVKRIGKVMLKESSLDRQMIAASILSEFSSPEDVRTAAGEVLTEALTAKKMENDVIDSAVISIGKLKWTDAVPDLCSILIKGGDPWLLVTTVRIIGDLEDKRALPTLLELWERSPVGYSWETGEVKVDTGAAGTADQEAAEAAWKKKYGHVKAKGKPPVMLKVYIEEIAKSVAKITGEKMKKPTELRKWMELHAEELRELGVEIPRYKGGTRKPGDKDDKDKKDDDKDKKDDK